MTETSNRPSTDPPPGQIEILFQPAAIAAAVERLGARLREDFAGRDPLILSLLGGSVIFLADLVRAYRDPVRFEFVDVGYRSSREPEGELLAIHYPISIDVAGQQILVVKDVIATGVTEAYLAGQFRQRGAAEVRFVALIDLPDERKTDLAVDYQAFSLERSAPLVGYGLKLGGRLGNLPYLGRLLGTG